MAQQRNDFIPLGRFSQTLLAIYKGFVMADEY